MALWVVSTFWLLWIVLLSVYKFLFGHMLSFPLGVYLGVESLGCWVTLCLTFWGIARLFFKVAARDYIPSLWCMRVSVSPHPHHLLLSLIFFIVAILVDMKCYHLWFWPAFPRWLMVLGIFSYTSWSWSYLLWRNIYSDPLPISNCIIAFLLLSWKSSLYSRCKSPIR